MYQRMFRVLTVFFKGITYMLLNRTLVLAMVFTATLSFESRASARINSAAISLTVAAVVSATVAALSIYGLSLPRCIVPVCFSGGDPGRCTEYTDHGFQRVDVVRSSCCSPSTFSVCATVEQCAVGSWFCVQPGSNEAYPAIVGTFHEKGEAVLTLSMLGVVVGGFSTILTSVLAASRWICG